MADNDGRVQVTNEDVLWLYAKKHKDFYRWLIARKLTILFYIILSILILTEVPTRIPDESSFGFLIPAVFLSLAFYVIFSTIGIIRRQNLDDARQVLLDTATLFSQEDVRQRIQEYLIKSAEHIIRITTEHQEEEDDTYARNKMARTLNAAKTLGILPKSAEFGEFFKMANARIATEQNKPATTTPTTDDD